MNNHRHSNTESIAHILIPQLSGELEKEINDCIARKLLTERHLAMAPTVSYKFWSNCCKAYIQQMLELGAPLLALPYMMAVQDVRTPAGCKLWLCVNCNVCYSLP